MNTKVDVLAKETYTPKKQREDAWIYGSMIAGSMILAVVLCIFA